MFTLGSYFFEELSTKDQVACSINEQQYSPVLENTIFPDLQAGQGLSRAIFMQDGDYPL